MNSKDRTPMIASIRSRCRTRIKWAWTKWGHARRGNICMTWNSFDGAVLVAAMGAMLCACAAPNANLARAIDIRLYDSDEQRLVVHNSTPIPIDILRGRNGRAETLAPNATLEIRFR